MKRFFLFLLLLSFNLNAEVSRSPAVISEECDLNIPTTKIDEKSAKVFTYMIDHQILIHSDDGVKCAGNSKKGYDDSVYKENARNEMKILFPKYAAKYSQHCTEYFGHQGLRSYEFVCETPEIISMTFKKYECKTNIEAGTHKVSRIDTATAEISYRQVGKKIMEKPIEVVQKEQCARVNECAAQATGEKEIAELKKLAGVACKSDLVPVSVARVPAVLQDPGQNDNSRSPGPKIKPNQETEPKTEEISGALVK